MARTTAKTSHCCGQKTSCECPKCTGLECLERPRFFAGQLQTHEPALRVGLARHERLFTDEVVLFAL